MALALVAPAAFAQEGTAEGTLPPPKVVTKTVETTTVAPAKKVEEEDPTSDHEKVVGHVGVGYLGFTNLKIATGAAGGAGGVASENIAAPVIGIRYWLAEKIGLDLGVGFGLTSSSTETVGAGAGGGSVTTTTDQPSKLGFVVHGGVPLVFAHQKHYKFLLVPELNVGFATATLKGGTNQPDTSLTGFHIDVGARVGAEIHFGFIGVPQLALQATVGAFIRHDGWKASADANGTTVSSSQSANAFGTSVQSDPWAIFANNISAIYYLP